MIKNLKEKIIQKIKIFKINKKIEIQEKYQNKIELYRKIMKENEKEIFEKIRNMNQKIVEESKKKFELIEAKIKNFKNYSKKEKILYLSSFITIIITLIFLNHKVNYLLILELFQNYYRSNFRG
jgi:hypothetical protein